MALASLKDFSTANFVGLASNAAMYKQLLRESNRGTARGAVKELIPGKDREAVRKQMEQVLIEKEKRKARRTKVEETLLVTSIKSALPQLRAVSPDVVEKLTQLVNDAYEIGARGLWKQVELPDGSMG